MLAIIALANSFGGGVSSIIVFQPARELGIKIFFRDFARLGIPVTLAALGGIIA